MICDLEMNHQESFFIHALSTANFKISPANKLKFWIKFFFRKHCIIPVIFKKLFTSSKLTSKLVSKLTLELLNTH